MKKNLKLITLFSSLTTTVLISGLVPSMTSLNNKTINVSPATTDLQVEQKTSTSNSLIASAYDFFDGSVSGNIEYSFEEATNTITILGYVDDPINPFAANNASFKSSITINGGDTSITNCTNVIIANNAFDTCPSITGTLTFSNAIISIGEFAFMMCPYLTEINLSQCNKLTEISSYSFNNCQSLSSIVLGTALESIDTSAFTGCPLESIDLSQTKIKELGNNAFSGFSWLRTIIFPDTLETIGANIVAESRVSYVEIPASVSSIDENAFASAPITSFDVNKGNEHYSKAKVSDGYILVSNTNGKWNGEPLVGKLACGDLDLRKYDLSNMVDENGDGFFNGCAGVESVYLSEKLPDKINNAFSECHSLTSIYLPWTTQEEIDKYASCFDFSSCEKLRTVYVPSGKEDLYKNNMDEFNFLYPDYIDTNDHIPQDDNAQQLALGLGLGLGLGIPAVAGITVGVVYSVKKYKTKK